MAGKLTHTVNMADVAKDITLEINVVGIAAWKLRMSIGMWLIVLGGRVTGCKVVVGTR